MEKKKLYEILGAKKFKCLVLKLEKIKFNIVKILFPNNKLYIFLERVLDKRKNIELSKATTAQEKKNIIENYKYKKLKIKRQYVNSKNDNYHLNVINVDQLKNYLNWNKKVHQKGLMANIISMVITIPIILFSGEVLSSIASFVLGYSILCGVMNFECINLQNYNLLRYEQKYEKLKKLEQRNILKKVKKYKDANEIVAKSFEKNDDIPTINDIILNIETEQQKNQLIKLIEEEQQRRKNYIDDNDMVIKNKEVRK